MNTNSLYFNAKPIHSIKPHPVSQIKFGYIETVDKMIPAADFSRKLEQSGSNFVGPNSTRLFDNQVSIQALIPHLDRFAKDVRKALTKAAKTSELTIDGKQYILAKAGEGWSGIVYKLTDPDGRSYAIKVYKPPKQIGSKLRSVYNSHQEFMTGSLFSKYKIRDCARFFYGHAPYWGIFEWINPADRVEDREGEMLKDVCKRLGLMVADRKDDNYNYPGGILLDMGAIIKKTFAHSIQYSDAGLPLMKLYYKALHLMTKVDGKLHNRTEQS